MECPDEPYDVGLDPEHRDLVKKAFNALINAKGRIQQFYDPEDAPVFDEEEVGMSWTKFLNHIKSYHPKLNDLFGTGIGLEFQRFDSDIAEATMLHFARQNIPVLPVHDSFIVYSELEDELHKVMEETYEEKIKASTLIKVDQTVPDQKAIRREHDINLGLYPPFQPKKPAGLIANERKFLMDSKHDYREYQDRLTLFRAIEGSSTVSMRQELKDEQDPRKFAKLELERLKRET